MKYFDDVRRAQAFLYGGGIAVFSASIISMFIFHFVWSDLIIEGDIVYPITENYAFILIFILISLINIIGALLYPRRYYWMWRLVLWTNIIGIIVLPAIIVVDWNEQTLHGYVGIVYIICLASSIVIFLHFHALKIKALFKRWKG